MPIATRLTNTGTLLVNGSFDENTSISPTQFRTTSNTVYAGSALDEMSLAAGSVSFNGSSQYLSVPSNAVFNQTGDFTIEVWVYLTGSSSTDAILFGQETSGFLKLGINSLSAIITNPTVAVLATSSTAMTLNTWYHLALVRSGSGTNNVTLYQNGVVVAQVTFTTSTNSANTLYIGGRGVANSYLSGCISNLRVSYGQAVYTAAFTPPQVILPTVSGTGLLLNVIDSENFIKDNSPNNFTVTNTGTALWNVNSPFGINAAGSIFMVGNTQWLSVPASTGLNLGDPGYPTTVNGPDFTIELWFYCTSFSTGITIMNKDGVAGASYSQYGYTISSGGVLTFLVGHGDNASTGTGTTQSFTVGTVSLNTRYHVAACQSGGNQIKVFLNGSLISTTTRTQLMVDGGKPLLIGWEQNQSTASRFPGYITNLRIIKNTAAYSTSFTPTAPLAIFGNTSLLLNVYNSATFLKDSSTTNATITNNGTATYSSFVPFGTTKQRQINNGNLLAYNQFDEWTGAPVVDSSLALWLDAGQTSSYSGSGTTWTDISGSGYNFSGQNGGGSYPTFNTSPGSFNINSTTLLGFNTSTGSLPNLDTTTWSIEAWALHTSFNAGVSNYNMIGNRENYGISGFRFGVQTPNGLVTDTTARPRFWTNQSGGTISTGGPTFPITLNTWYQVVVTYDGTNCLTYVNGTLFNSTTGTYVVPTGRFAYIGTNQIGCTSLNGQISVVKWYSSTLTADNITTNFNALRNRYGI
jgi:hypothetical protein